MKQEKNNNNTSTMLKVGTVLRGIYRIDRYLSSGGFGNTYVGYNTQFDEQIAIKEFFMKGVTARDDNQTSVSISNLDNSNSFQEQNEKFKKEAKRLRKLKNDHIVGVHDLFEENGTSYYIMDYIDGENLAERMKRTGKPLTEDDIWELLPQVLDALQFVHSEGLWHLDLKPGNIMVDKNGKAKLIDFGASKQLNVQKGGATASTASVSYTNGYAPREQMEQNYEKFGPWTDIYALGATLYALLTNQHPPLPSDIDDDDSEDKHEALPLPATVSDKMRELILWMMQTNRAKRPQSIEDVIVYCNGSAAGNPSKATVLENKPRYATKPDTAKAIETEPDSVNTNSSSVKYAIAACAVACILCVAGGIFFLTRNENHANNTLPDETGIVADIKVSAVVVVLKSADKLDYFALGKEDNGKYKVVKTVENFTPADDQVNVAVSTQQEVNQQNKIDAVIDKIASTYASAKIVFIAQRNLAQDPAIKAIDSRLIERSLGISYYNPNKFSGNETAMIEEYANQNL